MYICVRVCMYLSMERCFYVLTKHLLLQYLCRHSLINNLSRFITELTASLTWLQLIHMAVVAARAISNGKTLAESLRTIYVTFCTAKHK